MGNIIEFKPRETGTNRHTYEKAADVLPMPVGKGLRSEKDRLAKRPTLLDVLDMTWPRD